MNKKRSFRADTATDEDSVHSESTSSVSRVKKRREWTTDEDNLLLNQIKAYEKSGRKIDFSEISSSLSRRNVKQIKERWFNSLNPNLRKGKWKDEELVQLLSQIYEHGQNWTLIQTGFQTRSMHCIKSKGRAMLGESISKKISDQILESRKSTNTEWTTEELQAALSIHHQLVCSQIAVYNQKSPLHSLLGFETSQLHEVSLEKTIIKLGTGRTAAEVDRKLLHNCKCRFCVFRKTRIDLLGVADFKFAWTMRKSLALKAQVLWPENSAAMLMRLEKYPSLNSKPLVNTVGNINLCPIENEILEDLANFS